MPDLAPPILRTERLRLRPFAPGPHDVEALLPVLGDPVSMRWYPAPFDREAVRVWVERQLERYATEGIGLLVIEDGATGEVLGDCGLSYQDVDGERLPELGWHVRRDRQRQGIATEAGAACRDWAFTSTDVPLLISLIRPENVASRRVAEKLGFAIGGGTIRAGWGHLVYRLERAAG